MEGATGEGFEGEHCVPSAPEVLYSQSSERESRCPLSQGGWLMCGHAPTASGAHLSTSSSTPCCPVCSSTGSTLQKGSISCACAAQLESATWRARCHCGVGGKWLSVPGDASWPPGGWNAPRAAPSCQSCFRGLARGQAGSWPLCYPANRSLVREDWSNQGQGGPHVLKSFICSFIPQTFIAPPTCWGPRVTNVWACGSEGLACASHSPRERRRPTQEIPQAQDTRVLGSHPAVPSRQWGLGQASRLRLVISTSGAPRGQPWKALMQV